MSGDGTAAQTGFTRRQGSGGDDADRRGGGGRLGVVAIFIWGLAGMFVLVGASATFGMLEGAGIRLEASDALTVLAACSLFGILGAGAATWVLIRREEPGLHAVRASLWRYVILSMLPVAVLVVGFLLYSATTANGTGEGSITVLLLAGVIGLLLALAVVAVFFNGLQLNDRNEALGLPRGSIRAVIALALILIFAILSAFLYSSVAHSDTAAAADMAKQLITTVSTLVVAIASFYFGSNAVQNASDTMTRITGGRTIKVVPPGPLTFSPTSGGGWDPISFVVYTYPAGAAITADLFGDDQGSLTHVDTAWTYAPKAPAQRVLIQFAHADDRSASQSVEMRLGEPGAAPTSSTGPTIPPAAPGGSPVEPKPDDGGQPDSSGESRGRGPRGARSWTFAPEAGPIEQPGIGDVEAGDRAVDAAIVEAPTLESQGLPPAGPNRASTTVSGIAATGLGPALDEPPS